MARKPTYTEKHGRTGESWGEDGRRVNPHVKQHARRLKAKKFPIPEALILRLVKRGTSHLKPLAKAIKKYPLTDMQYWRSFDKNTFAHRSGVCLRLNGREGKILTLGTPHNQGYYQLGSELSHRVVAACWVENGDPERNTIVNHIDSNKKNTCADNLEWCNNSDNIRHARAAGTNVYNNPTQGQKLGGQRTGTSEYFGVFFDKSKPKTPWKGYLSYQGKPRVQRRKQTELEAAQHYNSILRTHGITDRPWNPVVENDPDNKNCYWLGQYYFRSYFSAKGKLLRIALIRDYVKHPNPTLSF